MSAHRSSDLDSSMHASNLAVNWWALSFHAVVFTPEGKAQLSFHRKYCKGIKKNRSVLGPIYLSAIQWVSLVQSARPALGIHWLVLISAPKTYEPFGTGWNPQSTTPQRGELVLSLFGDFIISHNTSGIYLTKKKTSSSWARAKKQKKIGAPEPLLGRRRQSTSSFALSVLVELRLGCYLLVWHRDGTKCLSCFGWYYRHLHILRRPRRNQLFDVHSLSSWGRRF